MSVILFRNCLVVIVLTIGLTHAFRGNIMKASIASRDGGTYMIIDSNDRIVTVMEVRQFVTITMPSLTIIGVVLIADFWTFEDLINCNITVVYIATIKTNITMFVTAYATEN